MHASAYRPPFILLPLGLLVAITAISFAAIFFRLALPTHPLVSSSMRLLIAGILLSPLLLRAIAMGCVNRRLLVAGVFGGLFYGLHFGTWVTSLTLTTVAASVTLVTATPLLLGIVAFVTGRDRPTRGHWIAIALATLGVGVIGFQDMQGGDGAWVGDLLAIAGAAAMAGYLLVCRGLGNDMHLWAFTCIAVSVGGAILALVTWLMGVPFEAASDDALMYIILAAAIPQLIGHTLLTWSLKYTSPTVVGTATVGEPVGSTILAFFWLSEIPTHMVLMGCTITACAVILAIWGAAPDEDSITSDSN